MLEWWPSCRTFQAQPLPWQHDSQMPQSLVYVAWGLPPSAGATPSALPVHARVRHAPSGAQQNTRGLMAAVSSLPELTERKRTIDKHTNLATALLGAIQVPLPPLFHHWIITESPVVHVCTL